MPPLILDESSLLVCEKKLLITENFREIFHSLAIIIEKLQQIVVLKGWTFLSPAQVSSPGLICYTVIKDPGYFVFGFLPTLENGSISWFKMAVKFFSNKSLF